MITVPQSTFSYLKSPRSYRSTSVPALVCAVTERLSRCADIRAHTLTVTYRSPRTHTYTLLRTRNYNKDVENLVHKRVSHLPFSLFSYTLLTLLPIRPSSSLSVMRRTQNHSPRPRVYARPPHPPPKMATGTLTIPTRHPTTKTVNQPLPQPTSPWKNGNYISTHTRLCQMISG